MVKIAKKNVPQVHYAFKYTLYAIKLKKIINNPGLNPQTLFPIQRLR